MGKNKLKRIVILRALQLGDLMCAIPAWRALRMAFPQAKITLVGLPWARTFVERYNHYLDDFIEFPGFPGFPEREPQVDQFPDFLRRVQSQRFDLAVQMQGSGLLSNSLTSLFGARQIAGFYGSGTYKPQDGFFLPYPEDEPEIWRHLRLMEFLGIPLQGAKPDFPILRKDWQGFEMLQRVYKLRTNQYVCLHPGARDSARRWPDKHFAKVADYLSDQGFTVVLTGQDWEADLTRSVAEQTRAETIDLAGKTDLGVLALLLKNARLMISNDTGVSHVAEAVCTPSVVLFSASDPARWAPLNRDLHRVVSNGNSRGTQAVMQEVDRLLAEEVTYAV